MRVQMLFSEKGEGSSRTGLVPKDTEEWAREGRTKSSLGKSDLRLKELKREEDRRKDKEVKASARADKRRMIDRIERL